ncbi:hypothetical protein C1645_816294 [Glomus cerebriforme]|uniref:Uncharacterized protein n=1 Tax=Glomus cerebriforme TaxID=658196 RepID=A0A397TL23_9GLOM|nr:hypothetical protein C1645_842067 [Glomus cerebriforme]RIA95711.1 hypothetical protein C1645_816294 [Glomus cerebriforme]
MSEILESLKETQHNSLKTLIFNSILIDYDVYFVFYLKYFQNLQELRFIKCIYKQVWRLNKIDIEKRNYYEEGLWLSNLKLLQIDNLDEYNDKLSSILLGCFPLINEI